MAIISRRILAVTLIAGFITGPTGGAGPAVAHAGHARGPVRGGTLRVALPVDAGTLDPRLAQDTSAWAVDSLIFNGLVSITNSLTPVPDLATSWKQVNAKTWVFYLRKGVKFSNGHSFTASDVVYTYKSLINPQFGSPSAQLYTPIQSVVAVNPYTVKFSLKFPYAPLLSYLYMGIVPATAASDRTFATHPIGTGPYVLHSWQRNNKIDLTPNATYFSTQPYLNEIIFYVMPDNTAQVTALKSRSLDLITSPLPPQDVVSLRRDKSVHVQEETGDGILYLPLNLRDPILGDIKVRQALNLLVDRRAIADQFFRGIDKASTTSLLPGTWAYDTSLQPPAANPQEAERLLAQDGWRKDTHGVLAKGGHQLSLTLSTYNDPNRVEILTYLQNVFQQVGIKANVTQSDWPTFLGNVEAHRFQIAIIGALALFDPDRGMYQQLTTGGASNWSGYSNPTVDHLLLQARQVNARGERKRLYVAAWRVINHDLPWIVLTTQGWVAVTQSYVQGYETNRTGSMQPLEHVWLSH
jgi:peptide/nickel transport system substrate-binding protein